MSSNDRPPRAINLHGEDAPAVKAEPPAAAHTLHVNGTAVPVRYIRVTERTRSPRPPFGGNYCSTGTW